MSIRIGGLPPGAQGSSPVQGTESPDQAIQGAEAPSSSKKSKKGVGDLPDSFEPTPQNPQLQGLGQPGVQPQQPQNNEAGKVEGSQHQSFTSGLDALGRRRRDRIDENGYKWTSFEFEPPTVKDSELMDPEDRAKRDALERMGELWKDYADRMSSQPIRA